MQGEEKSSEELNGHQQKKIPPVMMIPTHFEPAGKSCIVMTSTAVHNVELEPGEHYVCLAHDNEMASFGMAAILKAESVPKLIELLQNAYEDAQLLEKGLEPIHASPAIQMGQ